MLIPGNFLPENNQFFNWKISPDKILHFALFGPFSWLLLQNIISAKQWKYGWAIAHTGGITVIYSVVTELMQFYLPINRDGNILDFFADIVGGAMGVFLFHLLKHTKN